MEFEDLTLELSFMRKVLKTYNEVHKYLKCKLGFTLKNYGDLDNLTAQACYVKDNYVIWIVYHWVFMGNDTYVSGDISSISYHINE